MVEVKKISLPQNSLKTRCVNDNISAKCKKGLNQSERCENDSNEDTRHKKRESRLIRFRVCSALQGDDKLVA